jgi:hypothetical protein
MPPPEEPSLSVKLSLSPSAYTFSNPAPPVLALTIESHANRPLTLFTRNTPFHPRSGLTNACFLIIDTADNTPIPQSTIRIQRGPLSRMRGSGDEKYFLTLYPHTPTEVSTGFTRGGTVPPQRRAIVERGWELDERGNEQKIRRSTRACGADGLEGGHRYKVGVARGGLMGVWWRWGVREEMLVDRESLDWNLSGLEPEQVPLKVGEIEWVEFSVYD